MPLPFVIPPVLEKLLGPLLKSLSAEVVTKKLLKARAGIISRMEAEDVLEMGTRQAVRWCLYHQCKSLVRSGTLGDILRDHVDDPILATIGDTTFTTDGECYDRVAKEFVRLVW